MSACLAADTLADFVGGRLDGDGAARVEEHVDGCSSCFRLLAQAARTMDGSNALADHGPAGHLPVQIEEYRLLRAIGQGGMGQVFLAIDTKLDRPVAIKVLSFETRAAARERMLVEARAVARLSHPNVVTIHRVGQLGEHPYIVCEYVRGRSLDRLVKPLPWRQALELARGLARGLAAAHAAGVLHRDIKPANAMLADDGSVKLLDFGLAKLIEHAAPPAEAEATDGIDAPPPGLALTATGALLGTPLYMAPEAWLGEVATARMDVYSLGAVIHELCTGVRAHEGDSLEDLRRAAQTRAIVSLATLVPGIDPGFAGVVDRCLARAPAARFASAAELSAALEQVPAPVERPARRRLRGVLAAALLLVAAMAIVIGVAIHSRGARVAHAARPRVCSAERWCWDPAAPGRVNALWRHARDDAWMVGDRGLITHWDGHAWTRVASDSIASLRGVSGTASDDVWAAGQWGTVLHWNGTSWRQVEANTTLYFSDILALAADDVWAIALEGVVMHWDGKAWTRSPCDNTAGLFRIAGNSPHNVWVGGSDGNVLHWDGARWQNVDTGSGGAHITGIAVPDDHEVWIVGLKGVVRRGIDGHWADVELPISSEERKGRAWWNGIWANAPDDIWLLAKRDPLLHWDGRRWTGFSPGTSFEMYAIGGARDDLWAAYRSDVIVHWDGRSWQAAQPPAPTTEYRSVWASAVDDVWMAGRDVVPPAQGMQLRPDGVFATDDSQNHSRALVVHDDGGTPRRFEIEGTAELDAVWGAGAGDVWVAGTDGALVHLDGDGQERIDAGTHAWLHGLSGTGRDDVWAVGDGGTILHRDASTWRAVPSGTQAVLRSVWAHGKEAWVVGEHGTALHWDGHRFAPVSTGQDEDLATVWGSGPDDVWAGGKKGTLLHWDGLSWSPHFSGTQLLIKSLGGSGARDVWAIGQLDGLLLHWDGDHWNPLSRSPRGPLWGVFSLSPSHAWVVGDEGADMVYEPLRP